MKTALLFLVVLLVGGMLYVRLAPTDSTRWNVDPVTAPDPGRTGVRLLPGEIGFDVAPDVLLTRLDGVMRAQPRTRVLAEIPGDRQITYEIRSKVFGFPDYLAIKVLPGEGGGSTVAAVSRARFGVSDMGVNRARLDSLLSQVRQLSQ